MADDDQFASLDSTSIGQPPAPPPTQNLPSIQQQPAAPPLGPPGQSPRQPRPSPPPMQGALPPETRMFMPPWATPPQKRFSPYINSFADRDHTEWGMPPQFPKLPEAWELPQMYQGLGQFFGNHGSAFTGPLGLLLSKFSADYKIGQQQGREEMLRFQQAKIAETGAALELQGQRELQETADVFDAYQIANGTNDPEKFTKTVNGMTFQQALEQKLLDIGDNDAAMYVHTQGVGKGLQYLRLKEARWRDLHNANTKQNEEAIQNGLLGVGTGGSSPDASTLAPLPGLGPTTAAQPGGVNPPPATAAPGGPQTSKIEVAAAGGDVAAGVAAQYAKDMHLAEGNPLNVDAQTANQAAATADPGALPPVLEQAARETLMGGKMPDGMTNIAKTLISRRALDIQGRLQAAADYAKRNGVSGQALYDQLHAIDPFTADFVDDVSKGKRFVPGGSALGGSTTTPYWNLITDLTARYDPNWGPQKAHMQQVFMDRFVNGNFADRMFAAQRLPNAIGNVVNAVKDLRRINPNVQIPLENMIEAATSGKITGHPEWTNLATAVRQFVQQDISVVRQRGGAVYDERSLIANFGMTGSPEQILGALKIETRDALGTIETLDRDWKANGLGDHPPLYDSESVDAMNLVRYLDPQTGDYLDRKTLTPMAEDKLPASLRPDPDVNLSQQQLGYIKWARENPNSPKAQEILKHYGITLDAAPQQ